MQLSKLTLKQHQLRLLIVGIFLLVVFAAIFVLVHLYWKGKILPGISVAGSNLARLSFQEASDHLATQSNGFYKQPLVLSFEDQEWQINFKDIDLSYDISKSVDQAMSYGRRGDLILNYSLLFNNSKKDFPLIYSLDEDVLEASLSAISQLIEIPSIPPSLTVIDIPDPTSNSRVMVERGEAGRNIDKQVIKKEIHKRLASLSAEPMDIQTQSSFPPFNPFGAQLIQMRAENLLDKSTDLFYKDGSNPYSSGWQLSGEDLVGFLSFEGGFDEVKIASYSATLAESINKPPENALFVYEGGRVTEFAPARNGLELELDKSTEVLIDALTELENSEQPEKNIELPVIQTPPEITIDDVNDLGIQELLGRGTSTFHGSIANREHNIALASSNITGYLVPTGETFSFNQTVGDVSSATGFRRSYIIKEGRTILDDGGGVCQVSTTLFRAVMDAGLPIVERRAHSYRVGYYEQNRKAGYDATVFAPSVDLKFLNDTPGHLLIQAKADTKANSLVFEIYGTSDGRVSSTSNYRMWDVSPPPPDLYQDDPTLAVGVVKQVDWKAWGAKVKYDYQVERDGETIFEKTFYSNFRPWQSVFLRGTGGT